MQLISQAIGKSMESGSWIRQMFEAGIRLKKEYGENAVCDFSLGNPDLPPPPAVAKGLRDLADQANKPFALGYMPNAGFPWARTELAGYLTKEQGIEIKGDDVMLSCGAAGAMNAFLKTVLDPGDEVVALAPYFVEYGAYVSNHNGVFKTANTTDGTFSIDVAAIEAAITPKTRAVIVNSPNNPTGQVYSKAELQGLVDMLAEKSKKLSRPIYLIADEPYRFLTYDGVEVPSLLPMYPYTVVVSSFSKNLSLPGERLGYVALSPLMDGREKLMAGMIMCNRVLGYVNPPVVGQYLMHAALGSQVDASIYVRRKEVMADVLTQAGYEFTMPKGAFYFFPKAPGGDDVKFCDVLMKHLVLAVPGRGFGAPGYFRLTFCVDEAVIARSLPGFKKAIAEV